jgi:hypothetical protein
MDSFSGLVHGRWVTLHVRDTVRLQTAYGLTREFNYLNGESSTYSASAMTLVMLALSRTRQSRMVLDQLLLSIQTPRRPSTIMIYHGCPGSASRKSCPTPPIFFFCI